MGHYPRFASLHLFAFLVLSLTLACGQTAPPPPTAALLQDTTTVIAAGRVHGLKIGDNLDSCIALLGNPASQEGGGNIPVIVYRYPALGMRVEFRTTDHALSTIALLLAADSAATGMTDLQPQSDVAVNVADWAPYRSRTLDRWSVYDLPALRAWILAAPDGRSTHAVILSERNQESLGRMDESLFPVATTTVEPVITIDEPGGPKPADFTEILRGNPTTWEQGQVFSPAIWAVSGGGLRMAYGGGRHINTVGFARSEDGVTWTREPGAPLAFPKGVDLLTSPTWIPGQGLLFTNAIRGSSNVLGSFAWQLRTDGGWSPRGVVLTPAQAGFSSIDLSTCVRVGDRWYAFYTANDHGVNIIVRAESIDGMHWSNHRIVLKPDPAPSWCDGAVFGPSVFYDAASRTWTLWFSANRNRSEPECVLGRAQSTDGINFTQRVLFLRPETLGGDIRDLSQSQEYTTPRGNFLYMTVRDASRTGRIIRLNLPDPHKAPPFEAN